jgi:CubicO group peptidase (beta-lactamase class C family)
VTHVDGDSQYRIASITKVFTTLGLLYQHAAGNLSLDDAVDKYIPELKESDKGELPWKDITLRMLASQL